MADSTPTENLGSKFRVVLRETSKYTYRTLRIWLLMVIGLLAGLPVFAATSQYLIYFIISALGGIAIFEIGKFLWRLPRPHELPGIHELRYDNLQVQPSLNLSASVAAPGQSVPVRATGLVPKQTYNVIFGAGVNPEGATHGTVVGTLTARDPDGSASGTFVVPPSAASGTHTLQLVRSIAKRISNFFVLVNPPTLTITIGGTSLMGTSTLSATGPVSQTTFNGLPALSVTYINNVNLEISAVVFAMVRNQSGQTVYHATATVSFRAGQTATAYLVLAGLPSGTFSVTVFATTASGVVISTTSTASVSL